MPTGTGKTKTTMHTLVNYYTFNLKKKGSVVWLAHTTELLQQAYDTFSDVWQNLGDGQITVYKLWGQRDSAKLGENINGILFCGIQKLQSIKKGNPELFENISKNTKLIIFDEAHKAAASETRQLVEAFMQLPDTYEDRSLVGLTATPGRTTLSGEENELLSSMFENRLISIDIKLLDRLNMSDDAYWNRKPETNIIKYFQNRKILSKIVKEPLIYDSDFSDLDDATIVVNHDGDNITKVLVNNKEIETNVFDPIFEQFGSIFNDDFVNNFKQNFSSSIGANYYDNIQTIVNNNQEYAKKHKKSGVKDGILGKLKKFKLTKKYCKADKDGKVELPSCCICLSEIGKGKETIMLPCAHMFHSKCCLNWLKDNNTCPMCRFEIKQ